MKNDLAGPVSDWMTFPVITLREELPLAEAVQQLETLQLSALPVLDAHSRLTGLVSWAELRRAGRLVHQAADRQRHVRLPDAPVREFMSPRVPVIRRDLPLVACARRMLDQRLHRIYIAEDGPLEGVVSTRELLRAVVQAGSEVPLGSIARRSFATIEAHEPLAAATARLWADPLLNLVVLRDAVPIGIVTPDVALSSRQADPTEAVQLWMDPHVVSLPVAQPAARAAQWLIERSGRYIVAHEGRSVVGLAAGLDFAELIAERASA